MNVKTWLRGGMGIFALAANLSVPTGVTGAETLSEFELPRWRTGESVRLADFAGQILVLDFFAYWCAPCERASRDLESGVQQFYVRGNRHGVPVRVLSVNIEPDFPDRTDDFLRKTGASFVAHDPRATLLQRFGNTGIPFLAIIDGTSATAGKPEFRVAYQHAGFEGTRKIRQVIDGLGSSASPGASETAPSVVAETARAVGDPSASPLTQTVEIDPEFVWAGDAFFSDTSIRYQQERGSTTWDAALSYATYDLRYRPFTDFDFSGFTNHLHKNRYSAQLNARQRLWPAFTLLGSGGVYDGYPDYRRVWIAEFYRQQLANPRFTRHPAYENPDPKGYNLSTGVRWEYLPTVGFAEVRLGYAHDRTAPGYVVESRVLRGRERLDTVSLSASSENVLTERVRVLNQFNFIDTTDRELRFAYQGSINVALGERWVLRGHGGVAVESPEFDAFFFGATLEYEVAQNLLLNVSGRYYQDTGEIENSLIQAGLPGADSVPTSAAPPLQSWEFGVGLRYTRGRASFKLHLAPFWTNYDPAGTAVAQFTRLYADRNWGLAQVAYSIQF